MPPRVIDQTPKSHIPRPRAGETRGQAHRAAAWGGKFTHHQRSARWFGIKS